MKYIKCFPQCRQRLKHFKIDKRNNLKKNYDFYFDNVLLPNPQNEVLTKL